MNTAAANSQIRILVIDDDELVRKTIVMTLRSADYEVAEASDGVLGLKAAAQAPFDLVITDILMPNKEGIETMRELRLQESGLKIIAISGGDRRGGSFLEMARKLGADKTLSKPFRPQELLADVAEVLAQ